MSLTDAVAEGLRQRQEIAARAAEGAAGEPRRLEEVLRPISRRRPVIQPTRGAVRMAGLPTPVFRASVIASLRRVVHWAWVGAYVFGGRMWDRLRGEDSAERRARRWRRAIERVGGTFVKLAQQISMRIDLVPWEYCVELSKMYDTMPPFPVEEALAAIERAAGRPWQEIFATFDPEPVGSASIACVYQAVLKDGSRVAVKVRRPGIGELFIADLRVLDWVLILAERTTILRPGFTTTLRRDLREALLEELDFTREANFQDIFRRRARKSGLARSFTAPRVHFDLCSQEVIVQQFVSGMWLWELMAAVEHNDPRGRAMMRQLDIDPRRVARRILRAAFWGTSENLFFHADPHPGNIVVGRRGRLTFIDFGSCGSFNEDQRWATERAVESFMKGDVEGMSRATLRLFEPYPPMDVTPLLEQARADNSRILRTLNTPARHTAWWERTSASQWLSVLRSARRNYVPINLRAIRIVRATLLYDTLALRLDPTLDRYREYNRFREALGAWAGRRWRARLADSRREAALRLEELVSTGEDLVDRAHRAVSTPAKMFASLIDKGAYSFAVVLRTAWNAAILTVLAAGLLGAVEYLRTGVLSLREAVDATLDSGIYRVSIAALVTLNLRQILFRLRDREVHR